MRTTCNQFACNFFVLFANIVRLRCVFNFFSFRSAIVRSLSSFSTRNMQTLRCQIACRRKWIENTKSVAQHEVKRLTACLQSTSMRIKHFFDCVLRTYSTGWRNWKKTKRRWKIYCQQFLVINIFNFFEFVFLFLHHTIVFHFLSSFDDLVVEFQSFKDILVDDSIRFNVDNDDFELVEFDST